MKTDDEFARLADPYRRELLAYCYRMLGSVHDAEDLVQETYLRAWRARADYDSSRASLRTWLYRIATNACLTALDGRDRRPLPSGLGNPSDDPAGPLVRQPEIPWLQPFPVDPAELAESRDTIRLAFVTTLQRLPARQRAVLILRDVLAWRAAEVAALLETTPAGVNSALQRARAELADRDTAPEPPDAEQRAMIDKYVKAFVDADLDGLTALLRDDVVLEMPPWANWFRGVESFRGFFLPKLRPGRWRMVTVTVNGGPGTAGYLLGEDGVHHAHSITAYTVTPDGISWVAAFQDPALFATFGLPPTR
ncbi:sigma-70 family RNA polymerase sigma factor [Amycolatopsis acidicola]|uniref:RNA polymerase sigma factor n=1 Tax=Amycolatopsis acidicola TaxID=2596893 RepID=A0A5N0UWP6_9PSEU|nr:sigma-70 family RNA polymerase sigma factor [Amycolatopsis acidicola]KAA9157606.1 sigma-70 family RNA polymerase sigma factor [Amycolatopsis acidicola]